MANNVFTVDKRPKWGVKEVFPKCFIHVEMVQADRNWITLLSNVFGKTTVTFYFDQETLTEITFG